MPTLRHRSAAPQVARLLLAALLLLLLGAVAQPAVADEDDDAEREGPVVAVGADGEEAYAPAEVLVEPGEPVTFVWEDLGHSVTHDADDPAFDTHPDCRETQVFDVPRDCGAPGTSEEVVLDEPGVYDFGCHLHDDMTGTITVEAAGATPSDTPDEDEGSGSEDEAAGETDTTDEDGAGQDGGGAAGADAGSDASQPSEAGDRSERDDAERQQGADAIAGFSPERAPAADIGGAPAPDEGLRQPGGAGVQEPEVDEPRGFAALRDDSVQAGAAPGGEDPGAEPDLEPFPEASAPDVDDEVALPAPGGRDRTVPIALAALGVLGTGAAVLRQVLVTA